MTAFRGQTASLSDAQRPVTRRPQDPVSVGRVVPIYSGDLGGVTLRKMGVIPAGDLSGLKARTALMFALGAGWESAQIMSYFARAGADDVVTIA
jgi:L-asparaginase